MKKMKLFASALAALLLLCGCATKIKMEPTGAKIGAAVDPTNGMLLGEDDEFDITDTQVVAWMEFKNAYGAHTVRFKWTNDDDELVLDSGPIPVTTDDKLYEVRRVWSALPVRGASAQFMPGDWEVQIFFDGEEYETLDFDIND